MSLPLLSIVQKCTRLSADFRSLSPLVPLSLFVSVALDSNIELELELESWKQGTSTVHTT